MEVLRAWVMGITGAAVISAVCIAIAPEGRAKKVVRLVCGLLTIICLALPVTKNKFDFAGKLAGIEAGTEDFLSEVKKSEQTVTRLVIQERYETYISDKGAQLGIDIAEVSVKMRWSSDGYWYPVSADITADSEEAGKNSLKDHITAEMGIDPGNIYWS